RRAASDQYGARGDDWSIRCRPDALRIRQPGLDLNFPSVTRPISLQRGKSCTLAAMVRRYSSIGLFGIFGRSSDLRQVDQALRSLDIHPRLVPEAVKLTMASLLKERAEDSEPAPPAYRAAAEIVAYCMIGSEAFAAANDAQIAFDVEQRIDLALISGTNL